ncbi:MAG: PcfJ domain-containing protein, partial [Oscillospiraceae bacterium]
APYEHYQDSVPACLSWYAKHPIIEKLDKAGYTGVVTALVCHNIKQGRVVNWNADTIPQFFKGLNADEYNFFLRRSALGLGNIIEFYKEIGKELTIGECSDILLSKERYLEYRKLGVSKKKALNYCKHLYGYNLGRLEEVIPKNRKYKLTDYLDYIIAKVIAEGNNQIMYIDYLEIAKELNYDLSVHNVLFPKNLKEAHDNAVKNRNIKAEKDSGYPKRYKELIKMYAFEKDGFSILIPKCSAEIITEGKLMSHCVAGYAHRHIKGITTILFLRKTDDIDSPLYTIEVDDKTKSVRQIQGYNNSTPLTEEARAFFDEWKEDIKHRKIKKKKIKKSA